MLVYLFCPSIPHEWLSIDCSQKSRSTLQKIVPLHSTFKKYYHTAAFFERDAISFFWTEFFCEESAEAFRFLLSGIG